MGNEVTAVTVWNKTGPTPKYDLLFINNLPLLCHNLVLS